MNSERGANRSEMSYTSNQAGEWPESPEHSAHTPCPRRYLGYIVVLLVAFALRVWGLGSRSLWFDEAVEYWCASSTFLKLPRNVMRVYQPPLYTYLLHAWLQLGMEATWLRFLSIGLDMLTLVGVMTWAERLFSLRGIVIAGILTAVLPSQVRYAQEVGEYALMGCMLVWALTFLDKALRKPSWKHWGLWGLCSVASLYSHYGTAIVIVPLSAISLTENLWERNRQSVLQQTAVSAVCVALCLPLLVIFLPRQLQGPARDAFTDPVKSWTTLLKSVIRSLPGTLVFQVTGWPFSSTPRWIGNTLISFILLICPLVLLRTSATRRRRPLLWFFLAYLSYFAVVRSGLYGYGSFGSRYGLILAPLFILVAATVIEELIAWRKTVIATIILVGTTSLAGYSLPHDLLSPTVRAKQPWPEPENLREVTEYWIAHRGGESTYVYYGAVPAFRYYLQLYGIDSAVPRSNWYGACWRAEDDCPHIDNIFFGTWVRPLDPDATLKAMKQTLGDWPQRFWLVFSHIHLDEDQQILTSLKEMGYDEVSSSTQENASVHLLERE